MSKGDKSKQITCHAIDACTEDQLIDIFEESFGYLSFVEKFVKRIRSNPIDYAQDTLAASDKPLIILDIDNTILFVRFFSDEICVNDRITYYHNGMDETEGVVTSVWYRLKLELSDDDLIDEYGTDMIEFDHCHTDTNRLKKRRRFNYPYKIDEKTNEIIDSRDALIKDLTVIGCEIEYELHDEDVESHLFHKFISFEEDSIEISNFLPSLKRKGYKDAVFVYDGFIVRIRNGVEDFLDALDASWDIVFFTAANRTIYDGLMQQLHSHLCVIMGREEGIDEALWKKIFFRDDCTYDFDERGKLYHHKDLTKYNKDLSKVVIVDNSSLSYKSLEPNAILIKDFFGRDTLDNELDTVLEYTDQIIDMESEHENDDIYVDYRYILTHIVADTLDWSPYNDLGCYDRINPDDILQSTHRFLNDLKESLMKRGKLSTTLNSLFGEPKKLKDDLLRSNLVISYDDLLEDEGAVAQDIVTAKTHLLQSSITKEIDDEEGSATPKGNYAILEQKETKEIEAIDLETAEIIHHKPPKKEKTFSISIRLTDIPSFNEQLFDKSISVGTLTPATPKTPLDMIMQDPETTRKFSAMTEHQMIKSITTDDELESISSHNDGIGSRMLDDTDEEDFDESDWDDIEEEETEEIKIEGTEEIKMEETEDIKIEAPVFNRKTPNKDDDKLTLNAVQSEKLMAPNLTDHTDQRLQQRRFSSMKPRPDQDQIASGMSSVFLKRSVSRLQQFHENAQRRSSVSKSSKDLKINHEILTNNDNKETISSLKQTFEQQIEQQTHAVRRDSLRGQEAKQELDNVKDVSHIEEKPKPKKLILKVDNPWVAKLKRQGTTQLRALARVMRKVPKSKAPQRIKRKISPYTGGVIIQTEETAIVTVDRRMLPPAPIRKRKLPPAPKKPRSYTLAHITENNLKVNNQIVSKSKRSRGMTVSPVSDHRKLIYTMDNSSAMMTFAYTIGIPVQHKQTYEQKEAEEHNGNDDNNDSNDNNE